ncbi:hypothetical protein ACFVJW_26575 [Streptomyces libani]|uniref:hypothetical protein n=1 Tax=Streptomyces nigrescens TaxID=1920 RepID=UPI00362DFFA4
MAEGGEGQKPRPEETEHVIEKVDAVLAERGASREAVQPLTETVRTNSVSEPFRGLGENAETYRDRFEGLLAVDVVDQRREVRRNEDGSKSAFAFVTMNASHPQEVMKLREAAALAGVKESFAPLVLDGGAGVTTVHLGYEETILQDALPGRLQDPPWSKPEHDETRETPL